MQCEFPGIRLASSPFVCGAEWSVDIGPRENSHLVYGEYNTFDTSVLHGFAQNMGHSLRKVSECIIITFEATNDINSNSLVCKCSQTHVQIHI